MATVLEQLQANFESRLPDRLKQKLRPAGQAAPSINWTSAIVVTALALGAGAIFAATVRMDQRPRRSRR